MSVDLEGISGVVGSYQCPTEGASEYIKRLTTLDVNAAIEGAKAAGANEIWVNENHSGRDLLLDELDPMAEVLIGKPKPLYTMDGVDSSFDCIFMIGLHARAGTANAVLDHTWSPKCVMELRINGKPVGELGLNALVADYYNVPITLVTGDQAMADEAKDLLGDVECAVVKVGLDRYSARCPHPSVARKRIRDAAEKAVREIERFGPLKFETPIQMEIDYVNTAYALRASYIPTVERIAPRTVRWSPSDQIVGFKTFIAAAALSLGAYDPKY
ncbi:MAG: M55 family metallopeptidase [Chloroflexota bacterium]